MGLQQLSAVCQYVSMSGGSRLTGLAWLVLIVQEMVLRACVRVCVRVLLGQVFSDTAQKILILLMRLLKLAS